MPHVRSTLGSSWTAAAQSIGEPGTQLTMRTFHIGGTASRVSEQSTLEARNAGTVRLQGLTVVSNTLGVVLAYPQFERDGRTHGYNTAHVHRKRKTFRSSEEAL